jgi:acetolactate synthase-1/2/3 large subunit
MPGMHGTVPAVHALQKSDLLVALGARFDDRVTGKLSTFAPGAAVIHADIDPAEIGKIAGPEALYASGVGQHQMWASQFISYEHPYTWLNSGGAGTMGYAVPAAMGAKVGRPEATVWAIDGDGCFQMTNQELVTCAIEGIPIKVAIINNGNLGMVRQWQTLFYGSRYSNTGLQSQRIPDFVKLSEAMGCVGMRVETKDEVDAAIEKAMAIDDAPVVIDFVVGEDAMVWPMVPAGTSNDEILAARDTRPVYGEDAV